MYMHVGYMNTETRRIVMRLQTQENCQIREKITFATDQKLS